MFERYPSFLAISDTLEQLSFQVEDARTSLTHSGMLLNSLRGQVERVAEADSLWRQSIVEVKVEQRKSQCVEEVEEKLC